MRNKGLKGLYAITDGSVDDRLVQKVEAALKGGVRLIQYRDKTPHNARRLNEAMNLKQCCTKYGARLIINDDVKLAETVRADGVHLGLNDHGITQARKVLGEEAIIGSSCYGSIERAQSAELSGADYVAFGRFFPSQTKPNAAKVSIDLLTEARQKIQLPICVIGGINLDNAASLLLQGADMLAVVFDVFHTCAPDPRSEITNKVRAYHQLFEKLQKP